MPYVASESTASSAVFQQSSRQTFAADRASTSSAGSFDDLLNAIPDAPPEPAASSRADTPAPDRQAAPEPRATARSDRPDPPARADRPDNDSQRAQSNDQPAKSATDTPAQGSAQDSAQGSSDAKGDKTAVGKAGDKKAAKTDGADKATGDAQAAVQDALATAAQQTTPTAPVATPAAVVIDPGAAAATAATNPSITSGNAETAGQAATAAALAAATATTTQTKAKAGDKPAETPTDAATTLTADDAQALTALAAKAQQGIKDGQTAKPDKSAKTADTKAAGDKPAEATKANGNALAALDPNATQPTSDDAKAATAKPAQGEAIAKLAGDSHRGGDKTASADPTAALSPAAAAAAKAPDSALPQGLAPATHTAQAAATVAAAGSTKSSGDDAPVSISGVAVEVTSKIASGKNQFDIRLDPPDLGKIHVKVNVDRDGNVITHMVADRSDTLDLLRRDTSDLQRALQDAGLKTSDNSLQFSLRDQTANQQQGQQGGHARPLVADDDQAATSTTTIIARDYGAYGSRTGGLDIRV